MHPSALHGKHRLPLWLKDLLIALAIMACWGVLVGWYVRNMCNNLCPEDEHCVALCLAHKHCPNADN